MSLSGNFHFFIAKLMWKARYRAAGCGDNYEPLFARQRWAPSNVMVLGVIGHWNSGACPLLPTIQFVGQDDLGWKKNKCTLSLDILLQPFSAYFPNTVANIRTSSGTTYTEKMEWRPPVTTMPLLHYCIVPNRRYHVHYIKPSSCRYI